MSSAWHQQHDRRSRQQGRRGRPSLQLDRRAFLAGSVAAALLAACGHGGDGSGGGTGQGGIDTGGAGLDGGGAAVPGWRARDAGGRAGRRRLGGFEAGLGAGTLAAAEAALTRRPIDLTLPSWTTRTPSPLNEALQALGIVTAFDPHRADFSAVNPDPRLYVSDVVHEAFIAVDQEGTEAAAATAVVVKVESAPPPAERIVIDRPFLYAIRDAQTGTVLFIGRVLDPTAA